MMESISGFIKKEAVFVITVLCALVSAFFVPPSREYAAYLNLHVLALLFCLLAVVAGIKSTGIFERLSASLLSKTNDARSLGMLLVLLCFFLAMLITNDVALITMVPLTMDIFRNDSEKRLIFIVVMETVAANLGSLVTPVGNPQNLFLFSEYNLDIRAFFSVTLPLGLISLALIVPIMLFAPGGIIKPPKPERDSAVNKADAAIYLGLFAICLLGVFNIINCIVCLALVLAVFFLRDRTILAGIDYILLLTFVCFFIFAGNIARIGAVSALISKALAGREIIVSALFSQFISNVPAAIMLSSFTKNAGALIIGTNIGGLGTPVASLASLISYKLYCSGPNAKRGRYLLVFSIVNFALLAVMLAAAEMIF